ncbi:MAG: hypothetical protein ACYTBV_07315, partial [Planctomycetota bacterium]
MLGTISKSLSASQLKELKKFAGKVTKFGVNFAVCSVEGEFILTSEGGNFESESEVLLKLAAQTLEGESDSSELISDSGVFCFEDERGRVLGVVLSDCEHVYGTALIDIGAESVSDNLEQASASRGDLVCEILREMLGLMAEYFQSISRAEDQTEMVSTELSLTYEELVLLHKLSTNMKVTDLQMACDSLTDIVSVEGIAILLERAIEGEKHLVITAGSGLIDIDDQTAATLHSRLVDEINNGKEALLDSEVDSPFRYIWPENIRNIIAVPLFGSGKTGTEIADVVHGDNIVLGVMVAINRVDKPDFDSTDVKL